MMTVERSRPRLRVWFSDHPNHQITRSRRASRPHPSPLPIHPSSSQSITDWRRLQRLCVPQRPSIPGMPSPLGCSPYLRASVVGLFFRSRRFRAMSAITAIRRAPRATPPPPGSSHFIPGHPRLAYTSDAFPLRSFASSVVKGLGLLARSQQLVASSFFSHYTFFIRFCQGKNGAQVFAPGVQDRPFVPPGDARDLAEC